MLKFDLLLGYNKLQSYNLVFYKATKGYNAKIWYLIRLL